MGAKEHDHLRIQLQLHLPEIPLAVQRALQGYVLCPIP